MMIDEIAAQEAVAALFRAGIWHIDILFGVSYSLSYSGKKRLEIMDFFWRLMNTSSPALDENQIDSIYDFTEALLGHCRIEQIVRLHGDPEDLEELARVVDADVAEWKPPQ